ncbi:MAG TPA: hypothetical protein VE973_02925 [Candidatus Limnocylindria bacterium]|nr:hypothetical protein [Candidatus Limnocylindria bacterium]
MEYFKNHKIKIYLQWVLLVLLTLVLALSLYFLVRNVEAMKLRGEMRISLRRQNQTQNLTPDQIRGWMTFRYINLVFHLPPEYLKNSLNISDARYPNLSINSLAKTQKTDPQSVLQTTINSVKSFNPLP